MTDDGRCESELDFTELSGGVVGASSVQSSINQIYGCLFFYSSLCASEMKLATTPTVMQSPKYILTQLPKHDQSL
jgi:hypothetical protein